MPVTKTETSFTVTGGKAIASISVGSETINFNNFNTSLSDTNANLTMALSGGTASDLIKVLYAYTWSATNATLSATDTAAIEVTPTSAGNVVLNISVTDGATTETDSETITATAATRPAPTPAVEIQGNTNVQAGASFTLTAKALLAQPLALDKAIPYEFTVNYANDTTKRLVASLDSNGDPIITEFNSNMLTADGKVLFSSDKQILEVS